MEGNVKQVLYETIDEKSLKSENKTRICAVVALCLVAGVVIAASSFLFYRFANNFSECIDFSDTIYTKAFNVLREEEPINGASYKIFHERESATAYVDRCLFWPNDTECLHDFPPLKKNLQISLEMFEYMEACVFADFTKLIELGSDLAILRSKLAQLQSIQTRCRPFYNRLNECGTGRYVNTEMKRSRSVRELNEAMTWDVYYETSKKRG